MTSKEMLEADTPDAGRWVVVVPWTTTEDGKVRGREGGMTIEYCDGMAYEGLM
jgi:hypothetical protein